MVIYALQFLLNKLLYAGYTRANEHGLFSEPEKMKSMSQLAILTRRWNPATMKLGPFQEVILESSRVDELKEKVIMSQNLLVKYEKIVVDIIII